MISSLNVLIGGATVAFFMVFWCSFKSKSILKQMQQKLGHLTVEIKRINHHITMLQSYVDARRTADELDETKLYIGNIDYAASEAELAAHFAKFGQVATVNIPVDRQTGKARGFGFVTFKRVSDAIKAMDLDGSDFKGRQIQVNFARERAN